MYEDLGRMFIKIDSDLSDSVGLKSAEKMEERKLLKLTDHQ